MKAENGWSSFPGGCHLFSLGNDKKHGQIYHHLHLFQPRNKEAVIKMNPCS